MPGGGGGTEPGAGGGGGMAPGAGGAGANSGCNSGTCPAGVHAGSEAIHTKLCAVMLPALTYCST